MSYIGATPAESYASFYVQHFTTSATTSYALDYPVVNENDLRLVINNVVQQPGSGYAYTAAASTLTLSAATTTSDTMYAVFLGRALQTVNPPADSVGGTQLADTAISGQTALGAEPADTDEFLVSDAGVLKRVDYTHIKAPSAGAWTFIKSQTASASTSIDFVNGTSSVVFDDTYIAYQLKAFSVKGTTDKAIMTVLVSNDTGSSYETSGYKTRMTRNGGTVGNGYVTTAFMYADDTGTATGENMSYTLDFFNPAQTSDYARGIWTVCYSDESSADSYITLGGAIYAVAGAIDAFRIIMDTGTIASGEFYLYGLAKS